MDINKLTFSAQEVLAKSHGLTSELKHSEVTVYHLLEMLLRQEGEIAKNILEQTGCSFSEIQSWNQDQLKRLPTVTGSTSVPNISTSVAEVFNRAYENARQLGDDFVSVDTILLSLVERKTPIGDFLHSKGITKDKVLETILKIRGGEKVSDQNQESKYQALEKYTRDLTEVAKKHKLESFYRDWETDRKSTRLNSVTAH